MRKGKEKNELKAELLRSVIHWLRADENRGKTALEKSASELIADLKAIERELLSLRGTTN